MTRVQISGTVLSWDGVLEPAPYLAIQVQTAPGSVHEVRVAGRQGSYWQAALRPGQEVIVKGRGFRSYIQAYTVTAQ